MLTGRHQKSKNEASVHDNPYRPSIWFQIRGFSHLLKNEGFHSPRAPEQLLAEKPGDSGQDPRSGSPRVTRGQRKCRKAEEKPLRRAVSLGSPGGSPPLAVSLEHSQPLPGMWQALRWLKL